MSSTDAVTTSKLPHDMPRYRAQHTCHTPMHRRPSLYMWNTRRADEETAAVEHTSTVPYTRMDERATVLVVDDETSIAALLDDLLESAGYRVLVANSAHTALALARSERPALILTDCMMPGMDGAEFVRRLRSSPVTNNIPIVMMSSIRPGFAPREDITSLRQSEERIIRSVKRGVYLALVGETSLPFLEKPFDIDVVLHVVEMATVES